MIQALLLSIIIVALHGYWIYKLATYDWSNFEADSKEDDFLKPIDNNK